MIDQGSKQISVRLADLYWVACLATLAQAANEQGMTPLISAALDEAIQAGAGIGLKKVHLILRETNL